MKTILVCDDEPVLRALISATLSARPHRLEEATDGEEALERARALLPDLILLDMMMPGKSGVDVLRELRADEATAESRIVMLTARTQADDRRVAAGEGADRFLAKPFSPSELLAVVDDLLGAAA